jgi:hypothetical protein
MSKIVLLGSYRAETVQIYFPASLELQEELIINGFRVPSPTPIPIIYSNFGPWIGERPLITQERVIEPERCGKTLEDLGWQQKLIGGKTGYEIPTESAYLKLELEEETNELHLMLEIPQYHLEKVSIRGINPDKWANWAMAYISLNDLDNAIQRLLEVVSFPKELCAQPLFIKREPQQGGKEDTYFACLNKDDKLDIPVKGFSMCLGCFEYAMDYLRTEAKKYSLSPQQAEQLKLRLEYDAGISAFAKIGLSRMEGKKPQFMLKLVSPAVVKTIKGILKPILQGKARGNLSHCSHETKAQKVIIDASLFLRVACAMRKLYFGVGNPLCDRDCANCFILRRPPAWIEENS